MNKIDTKKWMEFGLESLFTITGSSTTPKNFLDFDNSNPYPYVTTAATNNGISGYSDKYTEDGNVLTVDSAVLGYCSYQEKNFTASDHVEKLIPKFKMTKRIALFLVSIINQTGEMLHYAYNEKRSQTALKKETIFLPVDSSGNPDREFMENYMKNLEEKCKTKLQSLILARGEISKVNSNSWKEFRLGNLFDISSPSPRSQNNYENGEIPFVASGDVNNGILKYCNPKNGENLDSGNCITVSPVDGSSFYQEENFLGRGGAGSSIMILRNDNLNKYRGLFIAGIVRKCCNFTYNDMGNREKLKNLIVKFPVDGKGNPNRDYMENCMKKLMKKSRDKLECLK